MSGNAWRNLEEWQEGWRRIGEDLRNGWECLEKD